MRSVQSFFLSLQYAWRGLRYAYRHEQNIRTQVFIAALVIVLGAVFQVSRSEWVILIFLICAILILELLNSAIEYLSDLLKPRLHEQVGIVKNVMAGVVLIASVGAACIGILVFWPYLVALLF